MRIRLKSHLVSQRLARNIIVSRVLDTVRRPDKIGPAQGDAYAYRKRFDSGILEVICVKNQFRKEYIVLTAYYL
jgi:hypothetical protein